MLTVEEKKGFGKDAEMLVNQLFRNFENTVTDESQRDFCYYALNYDLFILRKNELK